MKSFKDPRSWLGLATLFFSPNFHTSLDQKSLKTQKPVLSPAPSSPLSPAFQYNSSLVTQPKTAGPAVSSTLSGRAVVLLPGQN